MKCITISAHRSNCPNPISLAVGDQVMVGRRDTEYPGWIWVETKYGIEGWAPEEYLDMQMAATARVNRAYDATELETEVGRILVVVSELNGWYWVRNEAGDEGWVPVEKTKLVS